MRLFREHKSGPVEPPRVRYRGLPRTVEEQAHSAGYQLVAGVDEAGRGALAGPVVAAAILLPPSRRVAHVVDSKCLHLAQREYLFDQLLSQAIACTVGIISADQIDTLHIRQASLEAMRQAVSLLSPAADFALVDGNDAPPLSVPHHTVVDGDARCYCIAGASIIAKVYRDRLMNYLGGLYTDYGFAHNRGYGTPEHLRALREHGPSLVHRRSFAPVRQLEQMELFSSRSRRGQR